MKNKSLFYLVAAFIAASSCHSTTKKTDEVWTKRNIRQYSVKLPPNYSIYYSNDSLTVTIGNGIVDIYFSSGYFNVDGISDNRLVVNDIKIKSFKRVTLVSTKNHINFVEVNLWDTTSAAHLFNDTKYHGCYLVANDLTDEQRDTVIKIFNSLEPKKKSNVAQSDGRMQHGSGRSRFLDFNIKIKKQHKNNTQ